MVHAYNWVESHNKFNEVIVLPLEFVETGVAGNEVTEGDEAGFDVIAFMVSYKEYISYLVNIATWPQNFWYYMKHTKKIEMCRLSFNLLWSCIIKQPINEWKLTLPKR